MNVETNSSVHYELKMKLGKNSGLKMSFLEFFPAERLSVKSTSLCYNRPTVVLSWNGYKVDWALKYEVLVFQKSGNSKPNSHNNFQ